MHACIVIVGSYWTEASFSILARLDEVSRDVVSGYPLRAAFTFKLYLTVVSHVAMAVGSAEIDRRDNTTQKKHCQHFFKYKD